MKLLLRQLNISNVMPDPGSSPEQALIRHPVQFWIPAFAGMTALTYIVAGVICALCGIDPEAPEFAPMDEGARGTRKAERSSTPAFPRTPVPMIKGERLS